MLLAFMPIYWALGVDWPRDAFEESGSSLLTLGFAIDHHGPVVAATFVQATLGLGLVALLHQLPADDVSAVLASRGVGLAARCPRGHAPDTQAQLCLRAGYLALRRLAAAYGIGFDPDPDPADPISITREEFDQVLAQLAELGVPLKVDRDQAWRDFAGWRVNYDMVLLPLCGLLMAPFSPWSSDRGINYRVRLAPAGHLRPPRGSR